MKNIRSYSAGGGDMDPCSAARDQCKIGSLRCGPIGAAPSRTVGSDAVARLGAPPEVIHRARYRAAAGQDLIKTACILRGRSAASCPDPRFLQHAVRDLEIEFRQVATVQVAHQVSCTEIERCPDFLHFPPASIYPPRARSARFRLDDYAILQSAVLGLHSQYASNQAYSRLRRVRGGAIRAGRFGRKSALAS